MNRSEKFKENHSRFLKKMIYSSSLFFLVFVLLIGGYYFTESIFNNEIEEKELGEKVTITLPNGKKVYTYENLVVKKDGKLLYIGERNTIDLTGGVVVYENWE